MIEKTKDRPANKSVLSMTQNLEEILNLLVDRFDWLVASDQVPDPVQWFKYQSSTYPISRMLEGG